MESVAELADSRRVRHGSQRTRGVRLPRERAKSLSRQLSDGNVIVGGNDVVQPERNWAMCFRVSVIPRPILLSVVRSCSICGSEVWVSEDADGTIAEQSFVIICDGCFRMAGELQSARRGRVASYRDN